jgi:hypothetical protein
MSQVTQPRISLLATVRPRREPDRRVDRAHLAPVLDRARREPRRRGGRRNVLTHWKRSRREPVARPLPVDQMSELLAGVTTSPPLTASAGAKTASPG